MKLFINHTYIRTYVLVVQDLDALQLSHNVLFDPDADKLNFGLAAVRTSSSAPYLHSKYYYSILHKIISSYICNV